MYINKQILLGRVGQDPRITQTNNGTKVARLTLATGKKDETEWHNLTVFGRTAEIVEQYVKKGSEIYVEGETHHRQYERDGQTKTMTEVTVTTLVMGRSPEASTDTPSTGAQPRTAEAPAATDRIERGSHGGQTAEAEDVPF